MPDYLFRPTLFSLAEVAGEGSMEKLLAVLRSWGDPESDQGKALAYALLGLAAAERSALAAFHAYLKAPRKETRQ